MSLVKCQAVTGADVDANAQDYSIAMLSKSTYYQIFNTKFVSVLCAPGIGSLIGLPLMTVAWAKGIGIGGTALGLPYFLSAVRRVFPIVCMRLKFQGFYFVGYLFFRKLKIQ
jgi:hypothetical protein